MNLCGIVFNAREPLNEIVVKLTLLRYYDI